MINKQSRQLRIFISSTFQDMQQEREELIKHVFPKLKKIAQERFVDITEIDLRWGITHEQANSGETLKICLDEINKCKYSPIFFIGILGERYGWVPSNIDPKLFHDSKYSWLQEYKNKSVTELEILYAVLNNPSENQKSFFYFRDKQLSDQIKEQYKLDIYDEDSNIEKLDNLKVELKRKSKVSYDGYPSIEEFGDKVYNDILTKLDILYPIGEKPTALQYTKLLHSQFAQSRKRIYIKDQNLFDRIDQFFESKTSYLTIQSESGIGKSSLIANYVDHYQSKYPNNYVIEHYIGGAGEQSADSIQLLFRILSELKEQFNIQQDLPKYDDIFDQFPLWIYNISKEKKVTIFIDAIDQLYNEKVKRLLWILETLPKNIKIVISSIETLKISNSTNIELKSLNIEQQKYLISTYLTKYSKTLSDTQLDKILSSEQIQNTLYLKVFLDELRVFGEFYSLDKHIENLLLNKTLEDIFTHILKRIENDYNSNGTFKDIVSLLVCSKDGLSENEILEIINGISIDEFQKHINSGNNLKLSPLELTDILLGIDEHIIYKDDLITFFHKYIFIAVKNLYVHIETIEKNYRKKIADYFQIKLNNNSDIKRVAIELPYQLYILKEEEDLLDSISNINIFLCFHEENWHLEILKYYLSISYIQNKYRILNYNLINKLENNIIKLCKIIDFNLNYLTYHKKLKKFENIINSQIKLLKDNDSEKYELVLRLGSVYDKQNKEKKSERLYLKYINNLKTTSLENNLYLINMKHNLGISYRKQGKFSLSEKTCLESFNISKEKLGLDNIKTIELRESLGELYQYWGKHKKSEKLFLKSLKYKKQMLNYSPLDSVHTLEILGKLYRYQGKYDMAEKLLIKVLHINEEEQGKSHPHTLIALRNLGLLYHNFDKYDKSERYLKKNIKLCEKTLGKNHLDTIISLRSLARTYRSHEKFKKSEKLYKNCIKRSQNFLGDAHEDTISSYGHLALLYSDMGKHKKALKLSKRILLLSKKIRGPKHPGTLIAMRSLILTYLKYNKINAAKRLSKKTLNLIIKVQGKNHFDIRFPLFYLAKIYELKNKNKKALYFYKKAYKISKRSLHKKHQDILDIKKSILKLE